MLTDEQREEAVLNPWCVVCGPMNRNGLRIQFHQHGGVVHAEWQPTEEWESFQGVIHGGIVSTVLDEAMSKAVIARQWEAFTVELSVRFRRHVTPGKTFHIRGWVLERQRRKIMAEATLTSSTGVECARAWGTFLVPPTRSPRLRPRATAP